MKRCLLPLFLLLSVTSTYGQENLRDRKNERISFIVGVGASYVPGTLYQNPAINKATNTVLIEKGQHLRTSLTTGIVYTPYLWKIRDADENEEIVPKGISFATFINPVALSKATDAQSFFNIVDFGVGIGYKFAAGIMVMGTVEWMGVRQPRDWFVDAFKSNDKVYTINNAPQLSFDLNDDNIFRNKLVTTFGFKVCYTFDVIGNYHKLSQKK